MCHIHYKILPYSTCNCQFQQIMEMRLTLYMDSSLHEYERLTLTDAPYSFCEPYFSLNWFSATVACWLHEYHYVNKWLVNYPHCEAVNLPRIMFVTEGHVNNFLLCTHIWNLHTWPYSLLAMAMSCVLHMFLALLFMLVCEMFLWKDRTYGYWVSNTATCRGWEILHPDSNPEVHSSSSCLVFFLALSYRYHFLWCYRRRSLD